MTALKWITAALVAMLAFPAFVLPSSATGGSHLGNPGLQDSCGFQVGPSWRGGDLGGLIEINCRKFGRSYTLPNIGAAGVCGGRGIGRILAAPGSGQAGFRRLSVWRSG